MTFDNVTASGMNAAYVEAASASPPVMARLATLEAETEGIIATEKAIHERIAHLTGLQRSAHERLRRMEEALEGVEERLEEAPPIYVPEPTQGASLGRIR